MLLRLPSHTILHHVRNNLKRCYCRRFDEGVAEIVGVFGNAGNWYLGIRVATKADHRGGRRPKPMTLRVYERRGVLRVEAHVPLEWAIYKPTLFAVDRQERFVRLMLYAQAQT